MSSIIQIHSSLTQAADAAPKARMVFYKTGPGHYAEHDQFRGIPVPALRKIAKLFPLLPFSDLKILLNSGFNEERLLALLILMDQYKKSSLPGQEACHQFYRDHLVHVNNWNLVDASAPLMVGDYLLHRDKEILLGWAGSKDLWERRIAIVSTLSFIRHHQLEWTFKIAEILLQDSQDLIHKAVGWMLREAGKKDTGALINFLGQYGPRMPRTMLRYAIEKFPAPQRGEYLLFKKEV